MKNEAANAPIIFEEFVMVMINAGSTEQGCYNNNNNNNKIILEWFTLSVFFKKEDKTNRPLELSKG